MKLRFSIRWPFAVAAIYGLFIVLLSLPLLKLAFFHAHSKPPSVHDFIELDLFRIWASLIVVSSVAFLVVPVKAADKRPVKQTAIIIPILFSAVMAGLLAVGFFFVVSEGLLGEKALKMAGWEIPEAFLAGWSIWALVFSIWARKAKARSLVERQCTYLFRGSILELLIAVPAHVVARNKEYCCAGYFTFFGICLGISVMLVSFGPGIYFLYRERWRRIHPKAS
jgi:hypothetical protein